jgi:hypothetical protein
MVVSVIWVNWMCVVVSVIWVNWMCVVVSVIWVNWMCVVVSVICVNRMCMVVLQHIRQTVLQRAGSKSHMENVDEETEVKLAQVSPTASHIIFTFLLF